MPRTLLTAGDVAWECSVDFEPVTRAMGDNEMLPPSRRLSLYFKSDKQVRVTDRISQLMTNETLVDWPSDDLYYYFTQSKRVSGEHDPAVERDT